MFASLANGTLCVFSRKSISDPGAPDTGDAELIPAACTIKCDDEQFQQEAEDWAEPLILRLGESGKAAKCMTFVGSQQLWCGCGNTITVIDSQELKVLKHIPVFVRRMALVNELVSNGKRVWGVGRQLSCVMEWDVETFSLKHIFNCNSIDPTDEIVISDPRNVEELIDPDNLPSKSGTIVGGASTPSSEEAVAKNGFNVENNPVKMQTSSTPFSQRTTRKTLRDIRPRSRVKNMADRPPTSRVRIATTRDIVLRKHLGSTRTTSLVIVESTLWVGRGMGDVLVIDISDKDEHGKVLARLSTEQCEKYGNRSYNNLVGVAGEYVVSSQWLEPVNMRKTGGNVGGAKQMFKAHQAITVWKAWNHQKISEFMSRRTTILMMDQESS